MSFFKSPKQKNIYDYFNQIQDIQSQVIPNNVSENQYLAYLQNYLIFRPLFDRNVNLSVSISNDSTSRYDIIINPGYVLMDYALIQQTQSVTLTVDKQFAVDNDYVVIVFASYSFPLNQPVNQNNNYQLGLVLFDQDTQDIVPTDIYSDQAYNLFVDSTNKLYFKFFKFSYEQNQYIDANPPLTSLTFSNGTTISSLPDPDKNILSSFVTFSDDFAWDFGNY